MGRLQRKKTANQRKKSKEKGEKVSSSRVINEVVPKKLMNVGGFTSDTKKKILSEKKNPNGGIFSLKRPRIGFIDKSLQFLREVKVELKKVTWPSRKQTFGSTVVVIILTIIISLFLGVVDICLSSIVRIILH